MARDWDTPMTPRTPTEQEQPRAGRLRAKGIWCELGQVLDLSGSGLKTLRHGRAPQLGAPVKLTLQSSAGICATLTGKVSRVHRLGFRKHEIGVHFDDLSQADRAKLLGIVRGEFVRSSLAA